MAVSGSNSHGLRSTAVHVAAAILPPVLSARYACFKHASASGMNMMPNRINTASNPPPTSTSSPSTRRNSMLPSPLSCAFSRATASIGSEKSVASTDPVGPTWTAAGIAGSPVPHAMSRTRWPAPTDAAASMRSLTAVKARTVAPSYFFHAGAALLQLVCSRFLSSICCWFVMASPSAQGVVIRVGATV
jgi:hypothetical protein